MKNIFKIVSFVLLATIFAGCPSDDTTVAITPAEDVAVQYPKDLARIEDFLETHYVEVDADFNTTFIEITNETPGTPVAQHPALNFTTVTKDEVDYKVYYLKLQQGDASQLAPSRVDSVLVTYKGTRFEKTSTTVDDVTTESTTQTVFDSTEIPIWLTLDGVIEGWSNIFPLFNPGQIAIDPDNGDFQFSNYGAGVMFLPSALAYYNSSGPSGSLPSYSPLIFNFKLIRQRSRDNDRDRILSRYEVSINEDGTFLDTDGDGIPDYADVDDDGDGVLTKKEIEISTGVYYDYVDIPTCGAGGNGKKKHLDKFCQ